MAATAAGRSRVFSELARNRTSSPRPDDYTTASSAFGEEALHSTMDLDKPMARGAGVDSDDDGSTAMSIELGRGVKRTSRSDVENLSNTALYDLGENSFYDVTPRASAKKFEDGLRRQASVRQASITAKPNQSVKQKPLATALKELDMNELDSPDVGMGQPSITFNTRNTRFTRQPEAYANAAKASTPKRATAAQSVSAQVTGQSFLLPDLPNINELVTGVRKDGTPVFDRKSKSRSRFTSASRATGLKQEHLAIASVPIPDDEKAIYASLQMLKGKVQRLEADKADAEQRAERFEGEAIDLRSQLAVNRKESGHMFDAEATDHDDRTQMSANGRLHPKVLALQGHIDRSARKLTTTKIQLERMTRERDQLIEQVGLAFFQSEGLKEDNEQLQETNHDLEAKLAAVNREKEALLKEVGLLRVEKDREQDKAQQYKRDVEAKSRGSRSGPEGLANVIPDARQREKARRRSFVFDDERDLATKIQDEVRKHRANAGKAGQSSVNRSRSQTAREANKTLKRSVSLPTESEASEIDSATQRHLNKATSSSSNRASSTGPKLTIAKPREEDTRDLTLLSFIDHRAVGSMRKKIEEDFRNKRGGRALSETVAEVNTRPTLPRKSSLKDISVSLRGLAATANEEFARKSVRVQSPLPTDQSPDVDASILSNTSRRRRRTSIAGGDDTSAFILPDITIQATASPGLDLPQHIASKCTACAPEGKKVAIPLPVPVTSRADYADPDVTSVSIRPSVPPHLALATVLKQLEDEVIHLKRELATQVRFYNGQDPALGQRARERISKRMTTLQSEIDKKSAWIYGLYDVLEGQKQAAAAAGEIGADVNETLASIGMDPTEISGRVGRGADSGPFEHESESDDAVGLPWEGLSESESDSEDEPPY